MSDVRVTTSDLDDGTTAEAVGVTVEVVEGRIGKDGPKGDTGSAGPTGPPGSDGPKGDTGSDGPKGDTGSAGPKGDTGSAGPTGPPGSDGPTGPPGSDGPKGDTGSAGPTGPPGSDGPTGPPGSAGPTGPPGSDGPTGPPGSDGPTGPPGSAGPTGPPGSDGPTGPPGVGVPIGGTTGQVLAKTADADHATGWISAPTGGSGVALHVSRSINTSTTGQDTLTLAQIPYEESLQVFVNGALRTPGTGYTLAGNVVTFTPVLGGGQVVVDQYMTTVAAPAESVLSKESSFVPTDLSGLHLWLDAAQITAADGSKIATWPDFSGGGRNATQGSANDQPIYRSSSAVVALPGGQPVVSFDDGLTYMQGTVAFPGKAFTIAAVVASTTGNSDAVIDLSSNGSTNAGPMLIKDAGQWIARVANGSVLADANKAHVAGFHSYIGTYDGTNGPTIHVDGVAGTPGPATAAGAVPTVYRIGRLFQDLYPFGGHMAEILVYTRALTTEERVQVQDYLRTKYATP